MGVFMCEYVHCMYVEWRYSILLLYVRLRERERARGRWNDTGMNKHTLSHTQHTHTLTREQGGSGSLGGLQMPPQLGILTPHRRLAGDGSCH